MLEVFPLSALNHLLYCPRRAYLIHAEGVFVDNEHTILGDLAHEHVDTPGYEQRAGWELLRALPLFSDALGLSGKADLVEIRYAAVPAALSEGQSQQQGEWGKPERPETFASDLPAAPSRKSRRTVAQAHPVEYKKGPKRRWSNDEVQLCAQALCLEEMFGIAVVSGAIFHAQSQRRTEVAFDPSLRVRTLQAIADLRSLLAQPSAPPAELKPQCDGCSLREVCLPEAAGHHVPALFVPRTY